MNVFKEHKVMDLFRRYRQEFARRTDCLLDLDYHYMVLRRDYGNRFIITEFLQKSLSILVVSLNRFVKDACTISASALTFYSVLAFIPLMALAFAIATGFGANKSLEDEFLKRLGDNQEFAQQLLGYVNGAIQNAKGGVVTGVGIVILLWAVIRVLNSTELTMNRIWGVRKGRNLRRMFTDYFSIIFIAPILMILISSVNVFLTSSYWQDNFPLISSVLTMFIKLLPYLLVWMLFIFLYMFMPATPVKFKHAFVAAMIAGTVYQVIQWFYIRFQIGVSSYNAIYGSLAALPLLLVWLQLSWSVVLWGTELCYIFRNRHFMYRNELLGDEAWMETLECALKIMKYVARVYINGDGGPSLGMINKELKINTGKLRLVLQELVDLHLLVEAKEEEDYFYYPAFDLHSMSVGDIIIRFSRVHESRNEAWKKQFSEAIQKGFAGDSLV
ncbi:MULTISPECIES: YihY/virulence factor BrkB family protein [Butyricimonas]|uniref:YihY/virulence factor BrkB family protein n=1 Tax=Butyricimonas hominis TaxID=2763032 RepID=A0ABR7CX53_9BACT|nr:MULTISPECIES: YihY/virulence factor BrkB family protein [Butyricimonas]MBC5620261.1 YihY/virulence factor BrkB family protein [Butyricimonas hominis]MCB6971521.1 YihY/virulence factor BrkB family protein [Butyricimonas synergistica]MCG4518235.1 YihY/virulence factor BrkB family protein [Butyricimonas sp. DFI.6.44]